MRIAGVLAIAGSLFLASCASDKAPIRTDKPATRQFDNLIVAGDRVGPVAMRGYVDEIVAKLGNPDRVERSTYRGPGYDADEVYYHYERDCLRFTFYDSGLRPQVQSGYRGIRVTCDKWQTPNGLKVGNTIPEVVRALGEPSRIYDCKSGAEAECVLAYASGIWFRAASRSSPINSISIIPAGPPQ